MQRKKEIKSLQQLENLAKSLSIELKTPTIILLRGDLGTGKTAFTKKLVALHGLDENKIKSPTFSLINVYSTEKYKFFHLDLYRLEQHDQFLVEEIKEMLQEESPVIVIEWPEKIDLSSVLTLAKQIIEIDISFTKNNFRKISLYVKNC